jgi:hypothetical protein
MFRLILIALLFLVSSTGLAQDLDDSEEEELPEMSGFFVGSSFSLGLGVDVSVGYGFTEYLRVFAGPSFRYTTKQKPSVLPAKQERFFATRIGGEFVYPVKEYTFSLRYGESVFYEEDKLNILISLRHYASFGIGTRLGENGEVLFFSAVEKGNVDSPRIGYGVEMKHFFLPIPE